MTSVDVELGLTALAAMLSPTTLTFSVLALVLTLSGLAEGCFWHHHHHHHYRSATVVAGLVRA